jgi:hypothetical protein
MQRKVADYDKCIKILFQRMRNPEVYKGNFE